MFIRDPLTWSIVETSGFGEPCSLFVELSVNQIDNVRDLLVVIG